MFARRSTEARPEPASSLRKSGQTSNIVDFPRRPIDMLHAARATNDPDMLEAYSWHPIDDEKAFADAALEMVGEWLRPRITFICIALATFVGCYFAFQLGRGVL